MRARLPIALAVALWAAAFGLDRGRDWIGATDLPDLSIPASVEVVDRNGTLLRAYTVADGRWRMAVSLDQVDADYLEAVDEYERVLPQRNALLRRIAERHGSPKELDF